MMVPGETRHKVISTGSFQYGPPEIHSSLNVFSMTTSPPSAQILNGQIKKNDNIILITFILIQKAARFYRSPLFFTRKGGLII
jgi:hypothetical protein